MDEKELSELTRKTAEMLFGPPKKGEGVYALWRQFDPELAKQFSLFFTGRLYAREVLSQQQRELCAVAALAARNFQEELRLHCHAALNVGATKDEVAEVIFQMATYGGVPGMVEGLKTQERVRQERGEGVEEKEGGPVWIRAATVRERKAHRLLTRAALNPLKRVLQERGEWVEEK